jgi:hypothetical protein
LLQTQQVALVEKLITGKLVKQAFIDQVKIINLYYGVN